jgi:predicted enzyme related to lactoylglutathione lyase
VADRKRIPGKFVWFEHASSHPEKAQAFYGDVLGWKKVDFSAGGAAYPMIFAGETPDTMVGGYAPALPAGARSRWVASVSVGDVDAAAETAVARGGKITSPPRDLPGVGRAARIVDPQGAELALLASVRGDPADPPSIPPGRFMWNELRTTHPGEAVGFYARIAGFSHQAMPSPAGPYYVLSAGGLDRGGITGHLPPGTAPHWLPFVVVDDVDGAIDRVRTLGARVPMPPENVMDIGRLAILEDPTGAILAVMKPRPRTTPR